MFRVFWDGLGYGVEIDIVQLMGICFWSGLVIWGGRLQQAPWGVFVRGMGGVDGCLGYAWDILLQLVLRYLLILCCLIQNQT